VYSRFWKMSFLSPRLFCLGQKSSNQPLQPTALWRCAPMSLLVSVFSVGAIPRSQSGG
jgi:hypothetical protein